MDTLKATKVATVLVVDDTVSNLTLLSDLLKPFYRVKAATNGALALKIAQSDDPPDLILLDIMMPDMSGYDVCKQLKIDPRTRDIPVIFLSSMSADEDEEFGLLVGALDYITKPCKPDIVLSRVSHHLKGKSAADAPGG